MTNLTPERLAVIKLRFVAGAMRAEDLPALIAEVERLRPLAESQPALLAACEKHKKIVVEGHNGNTAAWDANYADMEAAIKAAEGE